VIKFFNISIKGSTGEEKVCARGIGGVALARGMQFEKRNDGTLPA
jgi:hypothetical protein